jgi:hypothetical protein
MPNVRNGITMPTVLSPFQNDAGGDQRYASSPENDQPNECRPPNLSLIKRCVERNENEKKNANLSQRFAEKFKTMAQVIATLRIS